MMIETSGIVVSAMDDPRVGEDNGAAGCEPSIDYWLL